MTILRLEFKILRLEFKILRLEFKILGLEFQILGLEIKILGLELKISHVPSRCEWCFFRLCEILILGCREGLRLGGVGDGEGCTPGTGTGFFQIQKGSTTPKLLLTVFEFEVLHHITSDDVTSHHAT